MAITPTPRFGLKQFSTGSDPHPTRLEHNAMIGTLEANAALFTQGVLTARPTAGKQGRIFWANDTKRLYYDDGSAWSEVSPIGGGGAGKAVVIGGAAAEGTAERAARADHTHAIPLVTVSANGAMLAADKKKLDAATTAATPSTLVYRDAAGAVTVATPTVPSHATTKAYVDGRIQEAAEYADDAVYNIPFASATEYGHMTSADKVKLDGATRANNPNTLVRRDADGNFGTTTPKADVDVANKGYVDAEVAKKANASHSHSANDINSGTLSPERVANASALTDGLMPKADKVKLDGATSSVTAGALVQRDSNGRVDVPAPVSGDHAANKTFVDAAKEAAVAESSANTAKRGAIAYRNTSFEAGHNPAWYDFDVAAIVVPDPGWPYHLIVNASVEASGGGAGTRWDLGLWINGYQVDAAPGYAVAPFYKLNGTTFAPGDGNPSTVTIKARRLAGGDILGVSSYNRFFTVLVVPAAKK